MYERFYGLRELPFELTPNPRYLYYTAGHKEALSNLQYGLSTSKAVTLLIGEAGTGKTTLLRAALESEPCRDVRCVYVNNPALTRAEFIESLARWFDLGADAAQSKSTLLSRLEVVLRERTGAGLTTALVVDEAQSLSAELLEEIRLLANIETSTEKLLPLVLAGQPELGDRLNETGLRQLKQRVALRCEIAAFTLQDTAAYMASRIRTAGGDAAKLFTREAVISIHEASRGIPRTISVICDNALLSGMALGRQPVGRDVILEITRDFDLRGPSVASSSEVLPLSPEMPAPAPAPDRPEERLAFQVRGPLPGNRLSSVPSLGASEAQPADVAVEEPVESTPRRRFKLFGAGSR